MSCDEGMYLYSYVTVSSTSTAVNTLPGPTSGPTSGGTGGSSGGGRPGPNSKTNSTTTPTTNTTTNTSSSTTPGVAVGTVDANLTLVTDNYCVPDCKLINFQLVNNPVSRICEELGYYCMYGNYTHGCL